jgi:hypothetical protein
MKTPALAWLALVLTPRSALACATCIASPFGDQTYTWPYLGLILLPFGLIFAIAGIFGYANWKARLGRRGPSPATACSVHYRGLRPRTIARYLARYFGAKDDPQMIKETT